MAGWGDLPTELTTLILQYLVSQQEIARALAVCRQFHALLEPKLYEKVSISKPSYEYDSLDENETETPQLLSLVWTIAARPELGLLVQSLAFGSLGDGAVADGIPEVEVCNTDYNDQQREEIASSWGEGTRAAGDLNLLLAAASQRGLPNGLVLNRNCARGKIVFLLHYLPNLLSLSFECNYGLATIAYAALGRFRGGVPVGLQTIKNLVLNYDDTELGFRTEDVVPFLALPALSEIRVWAFGGQEWEEFLPEDEVESSLVDDESDSSRVIHARTSAITHLDFGHSNADCDVLNRILTLPRRLERFAYDAGGTTVSFADFAPTRFIPGLCAHATSLVELFLTGVEDANASMDWDEADVVIGSSLTVFTALTHLRVNTDLLRGRPRPRGHPVAELEVTRSPLDALLPRSLVIFELELGYEFSLDYFVAVTGVPKTLMRTSHQLPALRKYHIGIRDSYPPSSELGEEIARLNSQPDVVSPRGHQISMKAERHIVRTGQLFRYV